MSHFNPDKLHTSFDQNIDDEELSFPKRYTLTHSDLTGELFLSVGKSYDEKAISGFYTRIMRDEVLAEWKNLLKPELHVYCHVSGGLVFGPAKWRLSIFRQHLPMILEAIIYGDQDYIVHHPELFQAPIIIHFEAKQQSLNQVKHWTQVEDIYKKL
jgi:hypothetical protein